jgi:ABC-type antimicrobial peptide transport system permease subunit
VLVVLQFTITQILVVGTFIVVSQMQYFQKSDMGFAREAIITMLVPDWDTNSFQLIRNQLKSHSNISDVSFSFTLPSGVNRRRSYRDIGMPEASSMNDYLVYEYQPIDPNYLDIYEISLLAGRKLTEQDTVGNILINETLLKNLQLGTPEEAVGKELKMSGGQRVLLVGVVKDFYSNSLKESVDNMVLMVEPSSYRTMSVKLAALNDARSIQEAISEVEKVWTAAFPEFIFDYQFFDDNVKGFYAQERKYSKLFQLFSIIFLLIGCLGLYGLITFVVNRKGKEVAVRKVLGATLNNILIMLSKEYVVLILISFLLAVPVAYYTLDSWLSTFANQITLHWWLFFLPGFLVLFIAIFVVTTKSLGIANANPIDRLKNE